MEEMAMHWIDIARSFHPTASGSQAKPWQSQAFSKTLEKQND
jgi:hypothetical protein